MSTSPFTDFRGKPLAVGDRVIPIGWGDGVPLYLSNTQATVVGLGRTRIWLRFDGVAYGGKFADYDAVNPRSLRLLDDIGNDKEN